MADVLNRNRSALPSMLGLEAYMAAYEFGAPYLEALLPYLQDNIAFLDGYLRAHMPKIHLIAPEGTYLMWLDCRELGLDNEALDHFFTWEAAVALDKGFWFGDEGSGFMRMNIARPRASGAGAASDRTGVQESGLSGRREDDEIRHSQLAAYFSGF